MFQRQQAACSGLNTVTISYVNAGQESPNRDDDQMQPSTTDLHLQRTYYTLYCGYVYI